MAMHVLNPVERGENLNRLDDHATDKFKALLRDFEDIARRANASTSEANAAEIWTEAFEHFFPLPEDMATEEMQAADARGSLARAPRSWFMRSILRSGCVQCQRTTITTSKRARTHCP
jgi:hypothetical protein